MAKYVPAYLIYSQIYLSISKYIMDKNGKFATILPVMANYGKVRQYWQNMVSYDPWQVMS